MDTIFFEEIGQNLEVYIDNLVVKTLDEGWCKEYLKETLAFVEKNIWAWTWTNACFGYYQDFILTRSRIKSNLDKWQVIIYIRIPTSMKKVQYLIGRIITLYGFFYQV